MATPWQLLGNSPFRGTGEESDGRNQSPLRNLPIWSFSSGIKWEYVCKTASSVSPTHLATVLVHTLSEQMRDAGVAEPVDVDLGKVRELRIFDGGAACLSVAHRGERVFPVLRPRRKTIRAFPRQRVQKWLNGVDHWAFADGVPRLRRHELGAVGIEAPPRNGALDGSFVAAEVGPFEAEQFAKARVLLAAVGGSWQ